MDSEGARVRGDEKRGKKVKGKDDDQQEAIMKRKIGQQRKITVIRNRREHYIMLKSNCSKVSATAPRALI